MKRNSVLRSVGIVGSFTLMSRALGLVRDVLMAGLFGTSLSMSAFAVAFTIPNLFRRLFGEGALSAAFVPVFVESRKKDGDASAWDMARKVVTLLFVVLLSLVVLGILVISAWLAFAEPGDRVNLILRLLRVMLPYALFICLAALSMATLNSYGHFTVPAATPCLLNIIWITALAVMCPMLAVSPVARIRIVAWAVVFAGVVQLGVQLPVLIRYGYRPGLSFDWSDPRIVRILTLMGPAALGLAITQFNVVIDRILAAWIGSWAPAALFYSERLIYFPLGIFATAMGTVLLPTFAHHAADDDGEEMKSTLNHSLRNLLFVMIPAAVGLFALAGPIIRMIFEWGVFDARSTRLTAIALKFYAPGLIVFSLAKVFVPAFYAMQDTRTPVRIGLWTVAINLTLNIVFVLTWPTEMKHAGLALATVLAETFYAVVLAVVLHRRMGSPGWVRIVGGALRALLAAILMGLSAAWLQNVVSELLVGWGAAVKVTQLVSVFAAMVGAALVYFATAFLLRCEEIGELLRGLKKA